MRPSILLFDLDGTLLLTGGAGSAAMRLAFEATVGSARGLDHLQFGGMTDFLIVREALSAMDIEATPERAEQILACYLDELPALVNASVKYRMMPGVVEILDGLTGVADTVLGLGTGNLEAGARIKLDRAGLNPYFSFGGFGCDHIDRVELLLAGARRGAEKLGERLDACRVVVIGDTPRDIQAAAEMGADCIAVATGSFPRDALLADGVTTFADLTDRDVLSAILGSR